MYLAHLRNTCAARSRMRIFLTKTRAKDGKSLKSIRGERPCADAMSQCDYAHLLGCSLFRVIPAAMYLDHFVSDRSHMVCLVHQVEC
ncbi:hypothetical protein BC835DRAFT_1361387 [Cytidiella melzeri]|nr:hypothetical protein BC835DRAFT_1361387 [Cytidiella melzeri]